MHLGIPTIILLSPDFCFLNPENILEMHSLACGATRSFPIHNLVFHHPVDEKSFCWVMLKPVAKALLDG